jgi:hypothetical protein
VVEHSPSTPKDRKLHPQHCKKKKKKERKKKKKKTNSLKKVTFDLGQKTPGIQQALHEPKLEVNKLQRGGWGEL